MTSNIVKSKAEDIKSFPNEHFTDFVFKDFDKRGDKVAFVDGFTGKTLTYKEIKTTTRRVGSGLAKRGFKQGDTLCIFTPNNLEYISVYHGVLSAGGTITTANPVYTARELAHQLKDSRSKFVVTMDALLPVVIDAITKEGASAANHVFVIGKLPADKPAGLRLESYDDLINNDGSDCPKKVTVNPKEDVAALPYSSGTTGLAKGVMLTHYNLSTNIVQTFHKSGFPLYETDVCVAILPMFHLYCQALLLNGCPWTGVKVVVFSKFDPAAFLTAIQKEKITVLHIVPPLVLFLAKQPVVDKFDLTSLRSIISGAAPLGQELAELAIKRLKLKEMRQGYGMTELSPVTHILPANTTAYGSAGALLPNTECKIVDVDTGKAVGPSKHGELWIRGPQVMKGYLNNPEATRITIDNEGFLHTGDIGYYTEEGLFYIVDRVKELIKYKGFQVAPAELEALLLSHPRVSDCAVIPKDDEEGGEVPKAFIVKNGTVTEQELIEFIKAKVAHFKQLRGGVQFIDAIPKSASGKILRRVLRDQEREKSKLEQKTKSFGGGSTRVWESSHIKAPINKVWELVKPLNFKYSPQVTACDMEGKHSPAEVGAIRVVSYKDKTTQKLRLTQLSEADYSLTWEMVESTPAVAYTSVVDSVKLRRVTEDNTTFIQWITDFSSDASQDVIQDAKYKRIEHFQALITAVTGRK